MEESGDNSGIVCGLNWNVDDDNCDSKVVAILGAAVDRVGLLLDCHTISVDLRPPLPDNVSISSALSAMLDFICQSNIIDDI